MIADLPVFSSLWFALLVLVIVGCGTIVQAGLGMGFGLTVAPLLALLDPTLVPGPTLYLGMLTATLGVIREPQGVNVRELGVGVIGRMIGVVIGAAILANLTDLKTFMLVFGIMVALAVILSASGWTLPFNNRNLIAMTTLSGLMGIITSVGAPPLALLYSQRSSQVARPTLAAFFMVGCFISLCGLWLAGWSGYDDLLLALFMLPGVVVGTLIARRLKSSMDKRYAPLLLVLAGSAAALLIVRGLI